MVYLRGRILPAMEIYTPNKNPSKEFFVFTGLPWGFASELRVEEYLSAVSRNL